MNNIVFKVTKKYMKLNRRRTAIAFMGVTLMVIMMTCVFVGKETVMKYLDKVASLDKGSWHIAAYDLDAESAKTIASRDYVEKSGISEQMECLDFPQTGIPEITPYLNIRAFSDECFEMNNITITEGRLPQNKNELIISEYALETGADIKPGDKISGEFFRRIMVSTLETGETCFPFAGFTLPAGESKEISNSFAFYGDNESFYEKKEMTGLTADYTIVGIMKSPSFEKRGDGSFAALTYLDGPDNDTVNILIRLHTEKISGTEEVRDDIESLIGREPEMEYNEMLLAFSAMSGDSNINTIVTFMEVFFTLFTMAASVILIYNVFNMSFAERTKYLGMLSSVGATRRQKRQSIYYESFALLMPALPAGIIIGMGIVYGASQLLKPRFDDMLSIVGKVYSDDIPMTLSFGISEIVIVIVMCVVTVLISALIPAIKISRIPPVESVKGAADNYTKNKKRFKTQKDLLKKGKPEILLAVNSTNRTKHLTRSIIRSITVFATLIMVTLYGANSIIKVVETKTQESGLLPDDDRFNYAALTDMKTQKYETAKKALEDDKSVTATKQINMSLLDFYISFDELSEDVDNAYRDIWAQYEGNLPENWKKYRKDILQDQIMISAVMVEDEEFAYLASRGDADMSIAENTDVPAALVYNDLDITTDTNFNSGDCKGYKYINVSNIINKEKGEDIHLVHYDPKIEDNKYDALKVAGTVDADDIKGRYKIIPDCIYIFINEVAAEQYFSQENIFPNSIILFEDEDDDSLRKLSELFNSCVDETGDDPVMLLKLENLDMATSIKRVVTEIIKILAYCFTAMISLVCLLNLYNSIRGRAAERTKETAILRSMGMTDKQFTKMHDLENLMLLSKGLLIAALICTALCLAMRSVVVDFFGNVRVPSPVILALVISAVTAAVSALMTRICNRSSKEDIISEIRKETV